MSPNIFGGLASVAGAAIQATWRTELEDGMRTGVRLKRLHAHCGVCTSPTFMLTPLWGMAWLWRKGRSHNSHARPNSNAAVRASVVFKLQLVWS